MEEIIGIIDVHGVRMVEHTRIKYYIIRHKWIGMLRIHLIHLHEIIHARWLVLRCKLLLLLLWWKIMLWWIHILALHFKLFAIIHNFVEFCYNHIKKLIFAEYRQCF